ncbi:hypothetical protein NFI96_028393 [Prochilodus magdalenae]|nr:hypothetical protein NFI96_028393 [Prochilodus magdalenae]
MVWEQRGTDDGGDELNLGKGTALCPVLSVKTYVYSTQHIAATGIAGLPEFSAVSFLHGKQIDYYDSNCHTLLPRQDWARRVLGDPYWQRTARLRYSESLQLVNGLRSAMESSGHKEGVHTFQRLYGCFWDEDTGQSDGFDVYGYDGVTFLSLDLESRDFRALVPEAKPMAQEWNRNRTQLESLHLYYTLECEAWLKTFFLTSNKQHPHWSYTDMQYSELRGVVLPVMRQFLRRSFLSVVVCHATHLSSKSVRMFWQKNEEEVEDLVEIGETLPSGDGSFQKTIYLVVRLEELIENKYKCALEYTTLTGKSMVTMTQDSTFEFTYGARSPPHSHHSEWGFHSEDDYGDEDYDDEDYDEDYDYED